MERLAAERDNETSKIFNLFLSVNFNFALLFVVLFVFCVPVTRQYQPTSRQYINLQQNVFRKVRKLLQTFLQLFLFMLK